METRKKILLIEDDLDWLKRWQSPLTRRYAMDIICARSIGEALEVFPTKNWDLIVVDGCIGGDDFNSPPLIQKMRETYSGPMVAASRSRELMMEMKKAGCSHKANEKSFVPAIIEDILEL